MDLIDDTRLQTLLQQILDTLADQGGAISELEQKIIELGTKPASKLELRYKITLPINKDGGLTGSALEIPYTQALKLFDEYYKVQADGSVLYYSPATGATTDNAKYPRSERRYYLFDPASKPRDDGFDEMINMKRGQYIWEVTRKYDILDLNKSGKVVIGQSHAVEAPPDFKVVVSGSGQVRNLMKLTDTSTSDDLVWDLTEGKNLDLTKQFDLYTFFDGIWLRQSLNGGKMFETKFDKKTDWYPKDGCYNAAAYSVTMVIHY